MLLRARSQDASAEGDMRVAMEGRKAGLAELKCRKSIQLAKYAAGETSSELLRPRPPRFVGKEA